MDNYGLLFSKSLGGGGGSGTANYNELSNKPQINSVTLSGNKSLEALGIQAQLTFDTEPTEDSTNPVESGGVYSALASKQDTLTIDATPTENSSNPVQSGGTYTALAGKQDTLTFDDSPTSGSSNPVKSGGVYSALSDKQDTLTFEGTYNASSNKAATESTVSDAIKALDVAGASGIAASKTISAWSETDGKASISTQDIAIAGTQAVLTGYTPESPSQTDSILATDTVNAAIKKLDERSRADENNILFVNQKVGVNLVNSASGSGTRWINIEVDLPAGTYTCGFGSLTGDDSGVSQLTFYGADYAIIQPERSQISKGNNVYANNITITDTAKIIRIYAASDSTTSQNKNVAYTNLFVCKQEAWNASVGVQPYALSNAELTAKEQANENNILSNVRNGVANVLDNTAVTTTAANGLTYTVNADKSITVTGNSTAYNAFTVAGSRTYANAMPLKRGTYIIKAGIAYDSSKPIYVQFGIMTSSSASISWQNIYDTNKELVVDNDTTRIVYEIYNPSGSYSGYNATFYPMIIDKSLYDAGLTEYQPPALSNVELTAAIQALQAQLANQ